MDIKLLILVSSCLFCSLAVCEDNANSSTISTLTALSLTISTPSVLSSTISTSSVSSSTIFDDAVDDFSAYEGYVDMEDYNRKVDNYTKIFEKRIKTFIKNAVKSALPNLLKYNTGGDLPVSTKCLGSFFKYISGLTNVKVWAMKSKCNFFTLLFKKLNICFIFILPKSKSNLNFS